MRSRHLTAINAASGVVSFALNILVVFVGYRYVVQHGGVATLGVLSLTTAWAFLARFADAGLATAITRQIASKATDEIRRAEVWRYVRVGIAINGPLTTVACLIAGFALYSAAGAVAGEANRQLVRQLLPPLLLSVLAGSLASIPTAALNGAGRMYAASLCSVAGAFVYACIVLSKGSTSGVVALALAGAAQQIVVLLLGMTCVWRLRLPAVPDSQEGGLTKSLQLLREGLPLQGGAVLNAAFEPLAKLLVGSTGDLDLVGKYELALKLVTLPRNLIMSGASALLPVMAAESESRRRLSLYRVATRRVTWLAILVLGSIALASPYLGRVWGLQDATSFFWLTSGLAAGYSVNCRAGVAYLLGQALARNRWNVWSSAIALAILLAGYLPVTALLGSQGFSWLVALALSGSAIVLKMLNERDLL